LQGATSYQLDAGRLTISSATGDPLQYNAK
jgi:hypothetical protein